MKIEPNDDINSEFNINNMHNNYYINNNSKSKMNKIIELTEKSYESKNNIVSIDKSKEEKEDEDILKKFHNSQINKDNKENKNNNKKGYFKREEAFSTIRHQLKDKFSLNKLGKIKWAKEHASANRPMNKLKEFNKSTIFCNCCNLPCETPGVIQPFSSCEKSENFGICGRAVPLYFYFIKYCVYCLLIILIMMSIPIAIFNYKRSYEIEDYCIYINNSVNIKYNNINNSCYIYVNKNTTDTNIFFNLFLRMSIDIILDYKYIFYNITDNKKILIDNIFPNYSFFGFICMLSLFIINIYFIILLKAKIKSDKIENVHPSDYTLLITNLKKYVKIFKEKKGKSENNKHDLKGELFEYEHNNINNIKSEISSFIQYLNDNIFFSKKSKKNLNIFNLNLCYKLYDFMILKENYEKCKYKIFQIKYNPYQIEKNHINNYNGKNNRFYSSIFTLFGLNCLYCSDRGISLEELLKEKNVYKKRLNLLMNKAKLNNFCGCAFATFNTIKDRDEFYNNYPHFLVEFIFYYIQKLFNFLFCCGVCNSGKKRLERIRVYLAPEPEDIIWENLEFTFCQRFYRIIIIYLTSICLILIAFQIVFALNSLQDKITDNWSGISKYGASLLITIIISLINLLFEYIMKFFTSMEKQKTMTNYYLSFSIKLTIFTFVTSAFVPFVSNILNNNLKIHNNKSLITNMLFIFLVNSFLTPILWTLNIRLIYKKIKIYFIERKKIPDSMHYMTQKELNELYEYPDMDIASKYSYISKTLLMTMFYLPIFPLGVLISLIGLIVAYFLEKFNFAHGYKRPEMLNEKLGEFHFNFFISVLICYTIGNYIFMKDILNNDYWKIVNISLFCILAIIPYTKPIYHYFNLSNDFTIESQSISDIYFSFYNDYQRQNPFTKKEGLYFYINELRNKGYISKFLYDIMLKNIEKINIMSVYYKASLNRNLRESITILNKNKRIINMNNLKKNFKKMINEKEKKLKALNENKENQEAYISNKDQNNNNLLSNNETFNNKKIDYKFNNNKSKDFASNNYKIPLLLNIGLEIDNLASLDFDEYNNKEEKENFNKISTVFEEENSSDENDFNF